MNKEEVIDLIRDAGYCFLATTEGIQPRVRPMAPYLSDDNQLLLALLGRSRSIQQAKENPLVELCYVDRKMWYCRIAGTATISDDLEKKEEISKNDLRKVKGGTLYNISLSTNLVSPSSFTEFKPNFNPYATENATAGIRG